MDRPYNNIIEEKQRSNPIHARIAFDELYPGETFKDWRIVHAFAIANIRNKKRKRSSMKRKKATMKALDGHKQHVQRLTEGQISSQVADRR